MLNSKRTFLFLTLALVVLMTVTPLMAQGTSTIDMWIAFTDYRLDWTKQKAADFHNQFPNLPAINVVGYPDYETLFTATTSASSQGSLPAIAQYFEVGTQSAIDSLSFTTITDAVAKRSDINGVPANLSDIAAPISAYYTVSRKLVAMPWDVSSAVLFSNTTMLQAAGIATPPKTWAEMDADCATIMAGANHPAYCFTWPNHGWFFEQWLAQQNALYANSDNGRTQRATELVFNNDAGVAALTWLKDMYTKGYLYYSGAQGSASWDTASQAFNGQQVAMAMSSSGETAVYTNAAQSANYGLTVSNLPYNQAAPGGWTGNLIGGGSLWLKDGLDQATEDAALTWMLWLTDTDNTADWHKTTGYMPMRTSAVKALTDAGWFNDNPNFMVAAQQVTTSKKTKATSGALLGDFPDDRALITGAIDKALLTPDSDPKALLDEAAASANSGLGEYNALNAG